VLLLTDRVDEWMLGFLGEFDGRKLVSVAKGELDLDELADQEEKKTRQRVAEEYKDLVGRVKAALGEKVSEVRVTLRLTDSPACVVVESDAMSQHLQRLLKGAGQKTPEMRPILELNPQHPLVERLKTETDDGLKGHALAAYPMGKLADRMSHSTLLGAGLVVLIVADLVLARAQASNTSASALTGTSNSAKARPSSRRTGSSDRAFSARKVASRKRWSTRRVPSASGASASTRSSARRQVA